MKRIVITENDFEQLDVLLSSPSKDPGQSDIVNELKAKLLSAITLPQKNVSGRVVTMNSRVRLNELGSNRKIKMTITFPKDANENEFKFSVFSEAGIALLGKSVGDSVTVSIPESIGHFEIVDVQYPSETAGDFFR